MDVVLAEKFVNRARRYTHYNINIMNEKGSLLPAAVRSELVDFMRLHIRFWWGIRTA